MTADSPELTPIRRVMEAHTEELMALPGVVGVAIGLLEDETTPCIKVLIVERNSELDAALPTTLEGHPVVVEETGVIRPLDED